ncbi:MAG: YCF48-related protein [Ignavibacteriae bacterium]|nr:YCF48-related protein [Ignavibacteriota bacterium]
MKFNIRIIILYFAFFFLCSSFLSNVSAQQLWYSVNSPTTKSLKKCVFTDSLYGWAAGDSGVIIHTTNSGINWTIQNSKTNSYLSSIFFLNRRLGWALAWNIFGNPPYGSTILKTTNGGADWDTTLYEYENVFLRAVYYQDSLTGFMAGSPANLIRTTNGGTSWDFCQVDTTMVSFFPVLNFSFYNKNFGYATGGAMDIAGIIWRTTNGGLRWSPTIEAPEPVNNIFSFDSLNGIAISGDFEYGPSILKTTNAGANWRYESLELFGIPGTISFRTRNEAWVPLGFAETFIYTIDTGKSWTVLSTPDSSQIADLTFTDYRHGFAVGERGRILRFNYSAIGINENITKINPKLYELEQNYPNPFNPYTKISYKIGTESFVIIKVYDITGKEIRTLQNGIQRKGKYTINFSGSGLTSGVYFYRLISRSLSEKVNQFYEETRKMIILK